MHWPVHAYVALIPPGLAQAVFTAEDSKRVEIPPKPRLPAQPPIKPLELLSAHSKQKALPASPVQGPQGQLSAQLEIAVEPQPGFLGGRGVWP